MQQESDIWMAISWTPLIDPANCKPLLLQNSWYKPSLQCTVHNSLGPFSHYDLSHAIVILAYENDYWCHYFCLTAAGKIGSTFTQSIQLHMPK